MAAELGIEPLVWEAQAITMSYERARGKRAVGERADGFAITATKTVSVPVDRLFDAFVGDSPRARWLTGDQLEVRTVTPPASARFDWAGGGTRVNAVFYPKGDAKSTVSLEHARIGNAEEAEQMKTYWRDALSVLKAQLQAGDLDA